MDEVRKHIEGIALVSGGMDSCVTAAIALRKGKTAFLHVDYGQRTEARERQAFNDIADFYAIPESHRLRVRLEHFKRIGGSSLTDLALPVPKYDSLSDETNSQLPITYVPFRNTNILAVAVSWAEVIGARRIYIGAVAEDSAGYPDCRPEYYKAFNRLVAVGSRVGKRLRVVTPLIHMTKREIVRKGLKLHAPFHLTWSCYEKSDFACGRCDTCLRRRRAFHEAGIEDPIKYESS